jgi:hypothetical protein
MEGNYFGQKVFVGDQADADLCANAQIDGLSSPWAFSESDDLRRQQTTHPR